jgi:hypothetical protein
MISWIVGEQKKEGKKELFGPKKSICCYVLKKAN